MNSMAPPRALICGVSGQDGAYLAQLLLSKGYEVWGTSRNAEINTYSSLKQLGIYGQLHLRSMAPEDFNSVIEVFSDVRPHEIYNLSGQSSVGLSFEKPIETMASISTGTINQLEAIRILNKRIKFFNAGSSEVFGDVGNSKAREDTIFRPQSPYAVAKAAAIWSVSVYRSSFGLKACTGILFNHESPIRHERFVTQKIVSAAKRIAAGSDEKLVLGNLEICRDWGWAPEYVVAMWKMLNREIQEDFVLATGCTQSLGNFAQAVFEEAGLDWRNYVERHSALERPSEPMRISADPSKAESLLGWSANTVGSIVPKRMFAESH